MRNITPLKGVQYALYVFLAWDGKRHYDVRQFAKQISAYNRMNRWWGDSPIDPKEAWEMLA